MRRSEEYCSGEGERAWDNVYGGVGGGSCEDCCSGEFWRRREGWEGNEDWCVGERWEKLGGEMRSGAS